MKTNFLEVEKGDKILIPRWKLYLGPEEDLKARHGDEMVEAAVESIVKAAGYITIMLVLPDGKPVERAVILNLSARAPQSARAVAGSDAQPVWPAG